MGYVDAYGLSSEGPRIHGFKMLTSIDPFVKSRIAMGSSFISLELVKNIVCVGQNTNTFELKEIHIRLAQKCYKKHETQFRLLGPLGVNSS